MDYSYSLTRHLRGRRYCDIIHERVSYDDAVKTAELLIRADAKRRLKGLIIFNDDESYHWSRRDKWRHYKSDC